MRRWIFLTLLALLVVPVVATPPDEPDLKKRPIAKLRGDADTALQSGDFERARELLREIARRGDRAQEGRARLDLALTHPVTKEQLPDRIKALESLVRRDPESWAGRQAQLLLAALRKNRKRSEKVQCDVPYTVAPCESIRVERKGGGTSTFQIRAVDGPAWRAALLSAPWDKIPVASAAFATERIGKARARFRYGTKARLNADFSKPGLYHLHESSFGHESKHVMRVVRTAISVRVVGSDALCFAFDPRSGEALAGIPVVVRTADGTRKLESDANGIARFPARKDSVVIAWHGDEVHALRINGLDRPDERALVHVATDRPVYRPGHVVRYKAVRRLVKHRQLALGAPGRVRVEIRDPQGRVLQGREHAWTDQGSVAGEFRLADRCATGDYSVMVHVPRSRWDAEAPWWFDEEEELAPVWTQPFLVAAYRKPEMRMKIELVDAGGTGKRKAKARIRAEYFHGGPVAGARVDWSITRSYWGAEGRAPLLRPPFQERLAWFARLYDDADEDDWSWGYDEDDAGGGAGETDASGVLEFEFDVDPADGTARYDVHAHMVDESDREITQKAALSARAAAVSVEAGFDRMFYEKGATARLSARVTDAAGNALKNHAVELAALLNTPRLVDDQFEYESVLRKSVRTGPDGIAHVEFVVPESGRMRGRAIAQDSAGRFAVDRSDVWAAGPRAAVAWDPDDLPGGEIDVVPERRVFRPGETMRFLVLSSAVPRTALLTVEGESIHGARLVRLTQRAQVVTVPALGDHVPNVAVKLNAWRHLKAESGGAEVLVCPEEKILPVAIESDAREYAPRDPVRVTVRAAPGAEIELGIVDESIFDVAGSIVPHLLPTFYRRGSAAADAYGSGAYVDDSWVGLQPWSVDEDSDVPLFGGQAEEAPEGPGGTAAASTRSYFPDTAYWTGSTVAGADGTATVTMTAPDSLTRWRIVARAVLGADRFGEARSEIRTRKKVVVRPATPRFLATGDEAVVGAIVHNNLDAEQRFTIRCNATGATVEGGERTAMIAAGGKLRVDWKVRSSDVGRARFTFAAFAKAESDQAQVTLPVRSIQVERRVAARGRVQGTWRTRLDAPSANGELEIVVTSAGGAIRQALPYLARYPYGCVEQTMSRFLPAVVAFKALGEGDPFAKAIPDMVNAGLQRLYRFQHEDGGWGWWENDETHPFMTAYVVMGLSRAKAAGFAIDKKTLRRGVEALQEMEPTPFRTYALNLAGVADEDPPKAASPEDAAYLVLGGHGGAARSLKLKLPETPGPDEVSRVALVVRALHRASPDDPRIERAVDWLLRQRRGTAWYSTLDTAHVVTALVEIGAKADATIDAPAEVTLNGAVVPLESGRAVVKAEARNDIAVRSRSQGGVYATAVLRYPGAPSDPVAKPAWTIQRRLMRGGKELDDDAVLRRGDRLRMVVFIRAQRDVKYVMARVPLPAGLEPAGLDMEYDDEIFGRAALFDDAAEIAAVALERGLHVVEIPLTATTAGTFRAPPAQIFDMYRPDEEAFSEAMAVHIR